MASRVNRIFLALILLIGLAGPIAAQSPSASPASSQATATGGTETINIDVNAPAQPFPHFWEQMFGSGRAILSLRDSYRKDLDKVEGITGFKYIRFHAILDDEVGVYSEDAKGQPVYNFSYVDQIYDGLLAHGVKPFVELSFMPKALAASQTPHAFWYKPLPNPPRDYDRWGELVYQFTHHLVERYGEDEVAQWYFEVWNEPNIDFWTGDPKQDTYFELYDHAAPAVKRASNKLRVGGPASAQAAWIPQFIQHCVDKNIPFDFVSTHVYGNDSVENVFHTTGTIPRTEFVCRAAKKVSDEVRNSPRPQIPIIWSEYNASYFNEPAVTDAAFMGPWLADTIRKCDGLNTIMSYWDFSDVFEEQGVIKTPFYGGFGLVAEGGVPKPAFNAFALLHLLGNVRIPEDNNSILVTRRADGTLVLAVWNLFLPEDAGQPKDVNLVLKGLKGHHHAEIHQLDAQHGSPLPAYEAMGRPASPTKQQYEKLTRAAEMPAPQRVNLQQQSLQLHLLPHALFVVEIR